MEKQNVHLKIIVEVCLVFCLLAFALLLLRSNFTYANSNQVYYLEDLKEGDYLPYGSVILTTEDYHGYSGAFYDYDGVHYSEGYINYARVSYYQDEFCFFNYSYLSCKGKYAGDYIDIHSSYSIKEFSSLFEEEDSYVGWVVKEVYGSTVSLLPVSDYSKINRTPALDNSYTIDTYFVNTESGLVANSWYLIRDIDAYEIEGEDFWTKEENVFHFRNTGTYPVGETYTLSFTFSAEAGNIVTFDTRSWWDILFQQVKF